jgi:hypothetical protein
MEAGENTAVQLSRPEGSRMAAAAGSIEISRRPEEVFTYVVEPLFYPQWDDSVVSAQRDESSPLMVGSKTTVMHRMGPLKTPTIEELVQLDPPRQFTNRGVTGPLAGIARCTLQDEDDPRGWSRDHGRQAVVARSFRSVTSGCR